MKRLTFIERLRDEILKEFPNAAVALIVPLFFYSSWWLSVRLDKYCMDIEWRPNECFRVSALDSLFCEEHAESFSDYEKVRDRVLYLLRNKEITKESEILNPNKEGK